MWSQRGSRCGLRGCDCSSARGQGRGSGEEEVAREVGRGLAEGWGVGRGEEAKRQGEWGSGGVGEWWSRSGGNAVTE